MTAARIILVDDHPIVLAGLRAVLGECADLRLVGTAHDAAAALRLIAGTAPDIAVLDVSLPGSIDGDLARRCLTLRPALKILVLTVHEDRTLAEGLLRAGAMGYLLKRSAASELIPAIRVLVAGGVYIDPAIARRLLGGGAGAGQPGPASLSKREESVLALIAQGLSGKEAAGRLALSQKTVETYRARAAVKIGARNRADIVRYGMTRGWLNDL
jgi:DNA-binding NarL/FixJ family response regulator